MIDCGQCYCGERMYRRLDDDDTQYECYFCKQLLIQFEEKE